MKQTRKYIGIAAVAMLLAESVQAAENLPGLVVTADRLAQDQASVSADVTVISQQDIEQSQATNVADLLRSQVGLDVAASGGPGKSTSVFMRGASSGQTLVLIDGVRVGSATVGAFDWGNLSTAGIERIEIVRGAQSSLYGADAMGGVIQLFTRQGTKGTQVHVHGELGSLSSSKEGMDISGMSESGVSYAMSAEGLRTQGVSAAANGTEKDGFRSTTLSGRIGIPVGQGKLELIARNVDAKTGLDGGFPFGEVLNFTSNTKQTVASGKFTYPINDMLETSLQLSRSSDEVIGRDPAGGFNNSDFTTRIDQLTWQNHVDLNALSFLFGIDMHQDSGLSGSAKLDKSITQTAGFASAAWSADMADINGSVRYDRNSVSQNKTTYKFGGALRPIEGLKLTANYGTGFKAPSINDLYFPNDGFGTVGNPNLKPETSKGWDAGIAYEFTDDALKVGLSTVVFNQTFNDLIVWVFDPVTFGFSPLNLNKARSKGVELAGHLTYGPAFLRANWTFLDAKDSLTGDLLPRRAKDAGNVSLGVDVAGLHAESSIHIVGPRFSTTKNGKPMAGYHTTALRTSYAFNDAWSVNARVENLENKKYEEVSGFGVLGRVWYAGMGANF